LLICVAGWVVLDDENAVEQQFERRDAEGSFGNAIPQARRPFEKNAVPKPWLGDCAFGE
jgi:hypothetical protein